MTTNHTPGPWRIGKCHGAVVADVPVNAGVDNDHAEVYGGHLIAESIAVCNRPLIAAAPDYHDAAGWILSAVTTNAAPVNLLAALEEMALDGRHVTLDAGLVLDLLKAHAKAKGEQQ